MDQLHINLDQLENEATPYFTAVATLKTSFFYGNFLEQRQGNVEIESGQNNTMNVDLDGMSQEFLVGVEADGKKVMVSSDDRCDHKWITVKEAELECKFEVETTLNMMFSVI